MFFSSLKATTDTGSPVFLTLNFPNPMQFALLNSHGKSWIPIVELNEKVAAGQCLAIASHQNRCVFRAPCNGYISALEHKPILHPSGLSGIVLEFTRTSTPLASSSNWMIESQSRQSKEDIGTVLSKSFFPQDSTLFSTLLDKMKNLDKGRHVLIQALDTSPGSSLRKTLLSIYQNQLAWILDYFLRVGSFESLILAVDETNTQNLAQFCHLYRSNSRIKILPVPPIYPEDHPHLLQRTYQKILRRQDPPLIIDFVEAISFIHSLADDSWPMLYFEIQYPDAHYVISTPYGTSLNDITSSLRIDKPKTIRINGPHGYTLKFGNYPLNPSTSSITFFTEDTSQQYPISNCIHCGVCHTTCPVECDPVGIWMDFQQNSTLSQKRHAELNQCVECGLCNVMCPQKIDLLSYLRFQKSATNIAQDEKNRRNHFKECYFNHQQQLKIHKNKVTLAPTSTETLENRQMAIQAALSRVRKKKRNLTSSSNQE